MPAKTDPFSEEPFIEQVARAQHEFIRLLARCIAKRLLREAESDPRNQPRAKKTSKPCHKN